MCLFRPGSTVSRTFSILASAEHGQNGITLNFYSSYGVVNAVFSRYLFSASIFQYQIFRCIEENLPWQTRLRASSIRGRRPPSFLVILFSRRYSTQNLTVPSSFKRTIWTAHRFLTVDWGRRACFKLLSQWLLARVNTCLRVTVRWGDLYRQ